MWFIVYDISIIRHFGNLLSYLSHVFTHFTPLYHQLQPASSFAMWSCLYSAIQTRLDFWLQHLTPEETEATCHTVDAELRDAVEALTYHGATASEGRWADDDAA